MKTSKAYIMFLGIILSTVVWANNLDPSDVFISGYTPALVEEVGKGCSLRSAANYTVLDLAQYQQTITDSRSKIQAILASFKDIQGSNSDLRMAFLAQSLIDTPFISSGSSGEGDWQSGSSVYLPGDAHVKQDPVYRLDGLNCQTFIQVIMALFYSNNLDGFDQTILKINYGAAGNPLGEVVHYFNRNNFVDGDWNPVNQRNGWLTDVTTKGELSAYADTAYANITRAKWFAQQNKDLHGTIRVLERGNGSTMAARYSTLYSKLTYPNFDYERVATTYIPKETLVLWQPKGGYKPNQLLFDKIPTPAVLEIVRDVKKWMIDGKNIKDAVGSEMSISHMGILYRKDFSQGDIIYQRTTCHYNNKQKKVCVVTPVFCQETRCRKLMFLHASNAWPNGYYWYKKSGNQYACSASLPKNITIFTQCNRVQEQPFFEYITDYQYGIYRTMETPSIIGFHVERLSD